LKPSDVPEFVSEKMGFKCHYCGLFSLSSQEICPGCGSEKFVLSREDGNLLGNPINEIVRADEVHASRKTNESEETILFKRDGEKIRLLSGAALKRLEKMNAEAPRKIIVPLKRSLFVEAVGGSETELLGDVRHDPYGGHREIGTSPYQRVVAGAIHEAHEGVLFLDELSALKDVQRCILTSMQEKKYDIVGRNPQSSGASVRVKDVPCDFILVAAANINDLQHISMPLRSRIAGNGYEILLNTHMPDTDENREKIVQFVAQEISFDKRIPPASFEAVELFVSEARAMAKKFDDADGALTLRLRELNGLIRLAGDMAKSEKSSLIEARHVSSALVLSKNIETQLIEKHGSIWSAAASEFKMAPKPDISVK